MKRITAMVMAAVFLLAFCMLGAAAPQALPVDGEYALFAVEMTGEQKTPESMGLTGGLSLRRDGTGVLTLSGMEEEISKWEEKDGVLTLCNDSGDPQDVSLREGIIEMDMGAGIYLYFAREGADTAGFVPENHAPDSKLYAVFHGIDAKEGAHLNYEYHSDYMDSTSSFDVHAKGDKLFSLRTTRAGGYEQLSASAFLDGTSYVLYPDEKRGNVAISVSLSLLQNNVLLLDDFYKELYQEARRTDYRVETREIDGVSYTVEVFPAEDYTPETAFYFDDAGKLVHILKGAPVLMPDLGETFYTLHALDAAVDETLFDISGYAISE